MRIILFILGLCLWVSAGAQNEKFENYLGTFSKFA